MSDQPANEDNLGWIHSVGQIPPENYEQEGIFYTQRALEDLSNELRKHPELATKTLYYKDTILPVERQELSMKAVLSFIWVVVLSAIVWRDHVVDQNSINVTLCNMYNLYPVPFFILGVGLVLIWILSMQLHNQQVLNNITVSFQTLKVVLDFCIPPLTVFLTCYALGFALGWASFCQPLFDPLPKMVEEAPIFSHLLLGITSIMAKIQKVLDVTGMSPFKKKELLDLVIVTAFLKISFKVLQTIYGIRKVSNAVIVGCWITYVVVAATFTERSKGALGEWFILIVYLTQFGTDIYNALTATHKTNQAT